MSERRPQDHRITVHKLDSAGAEVWTYSGRLLRRGEHRLTLEALFDHPDEEYHGLPLRTGDRFVETHYADRWYNVFAIHDVESGELKGWYCNITRPARLGAHDIWSTDLALDLVVLPDGRWSVLDEEEFAALEIPALDRSAALEALRGLQAQAEALTGEFASGGG
jgi:hypothetical protein